MDTKIDQNELVLLVDDDEESINIFSMFLKEFGYDVEVANNGEEALQKARQFIPNIILMDIMMPEMNGIAACEKLKENSRTKAIPIIFVTALSDTQRKMEAFDAGAVDYVTKPINPHEVRARITTHIKLQKLQNELKEKNEQLKHEIHKHEQTLSDLQKSNEELEEFAYVVSHDLKEPIRMITNFLTLLKQRKHLKQDNEAKEYVDYAIDGAKRMRQLIENLLKYSRVGRESIEYEVFDTNYVLDRVISDLKILIRENNAEINRYNLPEVCGDELKIEQLFQNLISNAIKFKHDDRPPKIDISARSQGDFWEFQVADNGIGIEEEYKEVIFQIFKRVDSDSKYPGTGIGLAICQKIVNNHGGDIWVESEPGEGTTFHFTLPEH